MNSVSTIGARPGALPRRTPGASGYQAWTSGDLAQPRRVVCLPGPAEGYMDPADPAAWAHVAAVLARPRVRGLRAGLRLCA